MDFTLGCEPFMRKKNACVINKGMEDLVGQSDIRDDGHLWDFSLVEDKQKSSFLEQTNL